MINNNNPAGKLFDFDLSLFLFLNQLLNKPTLLKNKMTKRLKTDFYVLCFKFVDNTASEWLLHFQKINFTSNHLSSGVQSLSL